MGAGRPADDDRSMPITGLSPARPSPRRVTRSMERWLEPTELERRLEAHLLIARKISR